MGTFLNDLRYGFRLLKNSPAFTAVAVLTMAVGIAANTTVFSWVEGVLLNSFPGGAEPRRVMALETVTPSGEFVLTSYPDYRDLRDNARLFDGISVAQPRPLNLGEGTRAERVWGELVSGNFFDVLRVKPALGRFFTGSERDDALSAHPVAVISYSLWKSRFDSDPDIAGKLLRVNRYPFTIIGVAPPAFNGSLAGLAFEIWTPATMYGRLSAAGDFYMTDRQTRMFFVHARLKPGVTLEQGREEVAAIMARNAETYPRTNRATSATLFPMAQSHFGVEALLRAPLGILMAVCGVVLLIVCANIANLLLARATSRERELGVRVALGASRGRITRQLLTETLLLALAGSVLGLVAAQWLGGSLRWLMPSSAGFRIAEPRLNLTVLAFTEGLAVLITLLSGLAPAMQSARRNVHEVLKEGGRSGSAGARSNRLRGLLVVSEVALAVVALVGAGLFVRSFQNALAIYPGFDPKNVAIAQFQLSTAGYNQQQAASFCRRLRDRLEATPGVQAVSYADNVPLGFGGRPWEDLQIEGYVPGPSENMKILRSMVAPGYFGLMRIPLLEGRDFTERDDENSLRVMIVTETFLRRFLPNQNAIGRKVRGWGQWFTIVGVVKDTKYLNLDESPKPYFYIPIRQVFRPEYALSFLVRGTLPDEQAVAAIRREAQAIDPAVALFDAIPLSEYITQSLFGQKVAASLLAVLGVLALLLASIGLYSVMAYTISQRTHELGIRMALGARPLDVLSATAGEGALYVALGLAAGSVAAAALARLASAMLIAVSPLDLKIYGAVTLFLALVSALAIWIPARRAMRVEPMVSLRFQ